MKPAMMLFSLPLTALFPVFLVILSGLSLGAAEPDDSKNRLLFLPNTGEPAPSPTPLFVTKPSVDPNQAIDLFFLALKADKVEAAYEALVSGTIIASRKEDVDSLKERTKHALDNYGPVSGYEVINEVEVGKSLLRRTCISLNSDLPLRWRFYFYKSGGVWRLVDLRVDDGLVELFEEAAPRRPR